jgi:hypothetical protein
MQHCSKTRASPSPILQRSSNGDLLQAAVCVNAQGCTACPQASHSPALSSVSDTYDSINVVDLQWTESDGSLYDFKYTQVRGACGAPPATLGRGHSASSPTPLQDHSKWGVAINGTAQQHYVCIGDMNRMTSQWARGGGTVCFRQANIYKPFLGSIVGADAC